jgi:hypothetical protein
MSVGWRETPDPITHRHWRNVISLKNHPQIDVAAEEACVQNICETDRKQ